MGGTRHDCVEPKPASRFGERTECREIPERTARSAAKRINLRRDTAEPSLWDNIIRRYAAPRRDRQSALDAVTLEPVIARLSRGPKFRRTAAFARPQRDALARIEDYLPLPEARNRDRLACTRNNERRNVFAHPSKRSAAFRNLRCRIRWKPQRAQNRAKRIGTDVLRMALCIVPADEQPGLFRQRGKRSFAHDSIQAIVDSGGKTGLASPQKGGTRGSVVVTCSVPKLVPIVSTAPSPSRHLATTAA